jgi:DNA-binding transcriptional LysR family regulator
MPDVVRSLLREYPDLRLDLVLRDDLPASPADRADLQVIVEQDDFVPGLGARAHHLLDDPYVVVLPRTHPLVSAREVELGALAGDRWVDNDIARGWCRRNLLQACRAAGFSPQFQVEAHDYPTAIAFVDAGIGLTVLPRLAARSLPDGVVAVPVTAPTPLRSIYALVQTSVEGSGPARTALAVLRRCAQRSRGRRRATSHGTNR